MLGLSKDRERNARWQRAAELLLAEADVGAPSKAVELALFYDAKLWPAPGSEDTELGVLMELEVGHGETEVYPGVQA
jgi:hypothetical protein